LFGPNSVLADEFYAEPAADAKGWFNVIGFPECRHDGRRKKCGCTKAGTQRFKCLECGKKFTDSTRTLGGMRIGVDRTAQVISFLVEGLSVRAVARLTGMDKNTILSMLLAVGEKCKLYLENAIENVQVKDVSVDELWAFVGMKERTRKILSRPVGEVGDCYTFVGMERNTRFVLAYHVGSRTDWNGRQFISKLHKACAKERFQVSSDGWRPYKYTIPTRLPQADYGQIIKVFGAAPDTTRYSPGRIIECRLKTIAGNPDENRINTSHSERLNLSIRMGMRRFTRLTNGFSRSHAHHEAAIALFFMHYNFCAKHGTLKTTPAVAAKLTDKQWTVAEMIERTANYRKPEPPKGWDAFLATIPDSE
jgi:transposase-like protein/IS1 family transposase